MKAISVFIAISFHLYGMVQQNLVPNGSFEEYTECPDAISQLDRVVGWTSPNLGTPDYMNACDQTNVMGIPQNSRGNQVANDGSAYSLICTYNPNIVYREYLQTNLTSTLIVNQAYTISLFVSKSDNLKHSTNNLGIYLSPNSVYINNTNPIDVIPNYNYQSLITDEQNWMKIEFDYTANGDENFLIIGNFFDDINTSTTISNNNASFDAASYYIDNVKVEQKLNKLPNYELQASFFNYNQELKILNLINNEIEEIKIFDQTGKMVNHTLFLEKSNINLQNNIKGLYFIQIKLSNQTIYNYKFLI